MRLKQKVLLGIAGVAGLFSVAAAHHCTGPERRAEWVIRRIARKLDLNEVQKGKLLAVKDAVLAARADRKQVRKDNLAFLIEQVKSDNLDAAGIQARIRSRHDSVEKALPGILAKLAEFHGSLDDSQKAKLVEKISDWRDLMHE